MAQELEIEFVFELLSFGRDLRRLDMRKGTCKFHDDAKQFEVLIEEGFLVGDDVGRGNGGEDADLVERILLLFLF